MFISYSKADAAAAQRVADALRASGLSVWWDTTGLAPGGEFSAEIERQLDAAKHVLVLWSKKAARSEWVRDEADHAKRQGKLVAAIIDDLALPPIGFRQRHAPSLKGWRGDPRDPAFAPVLDTLGGVAPREPAAAPQPEPAAPNQQGEELKPGWIVPALVALCIGVFALVRFDNAWPLFPLFGENLSTQIWVGEVFAVIVCAVLALGAALFYRGATSLFMGAALAIAAGVAVDGGVMIQFENGGMSGVFIASAYAQEMPDPAIAARHEMTSALVGFLVIGLGAMLTWAWRRGASAAWAGLVALVVVAQLFEVTSWRGESDAFASLWFEQSPMILPMHLGVVALAGAAVLIAAKLRYIR